jgi:hypothetical protein
MPPKPAKTTPRPRKTKAEVQQEFESIREQVETARESADAKAAEAARIRESEIRQAVEGVTVESVVQKISGLGLEISRSLSDLSAKLVEQVHLLAGVRDAVALERKELERMHQIDVAATAVDQLVEDYARQNRELEAETAARRAGWEEEVRTSERERKEQEEALRRQRQREIEEYEYKKNLERKKAQDRYDEELRLQEKRNAERQELLEKGWQQRETALKEREEELARLQQESSGFAGRVEKEAKAAAAEAARAAESGFQQQIAMLQKDAEGERRINALQVKSLDDTVARQAEHIAVLEKQLAEAKQQVQDIAVKAIEGASGARALSHINQIAMEQAKNRPAG